MGSTGVRTVHGGSLDPGSIPGCSTRKGEKMIQHDKIAEQSCQCGPYCLQHRKVLRTWFSVGPVPVPKAWIGNRRVKYLFDVQKGWSKNLSFKQAIGVQLCWYRRLILGKATY